MAFRRVPMESGERDRVITIQQRTTVPKDASGAPNPDAGWTTLVTMRAAMIDISGVEPFRADQLAAKYNRRWEINYRADMDPALVKNVPKARRVLYENRVEDIVSASEIGRREGIELLTLIKADRA